MGMLFIWLVWWLIGIVSTIYVIRSYRDFYAFELWFTIPMAAFAGPLLALAWLPDAPPQPPKILFKRKGS